MNSITRSVSKFRTAIIAVVLSAAVVASAAFVRIHDDRSMSSNLPAFSETTVAPLLALDRATEAIAARIIPAVVNIHVEGKTMPSRASGQGQMDPSQIPEPFRQFFQFGPGEMPMQPQYFSAQGSGVIISPDGYIVTNNHVVHGATTVDVILNDKREFDGAKVVGSDPNTDLAVVKINATGLPSAAFGDSSLLKPGQSVLAIGDPLGMDFSVTRGIVSATGRSRTQDGSNAYGSFIQTDAPINHGNSGGPLVDAQGDVIGINTEMLSTSGASAGIGFAIPSDVVQPIAESLMKNGKVVRGYLGIDVTDLQAAIAESLDESGLHGALVNQVNGGSPAQAAGIQPYDVVTAFNGHKVSNGTELQTLSGAAAPGSVAKLELVRDGKPMTISVTLGDYAKQGSAAADADETGSGSSDATPKLGVSVAPSDNGSGVVVQSVAPGSPAQMAGIAQGDVIKQVNRKSISTPEQMRQQLSRSPAGKDILLLIHNANGDFIIPVRPR